MQVIYNENYMKNKGKKPIKICIPVNLKKYFPSKTMSNFFSYITLAAQINEEKQNKDFSVWFEKQYEKQDEINQYRSIHYLPSMEYSYLNFLKFVEARTALIKDELVKILL